jgi:hypothetical protein
MAAELLIEQFGHEIGKQAAAEWVEFELEVAADKVVIVIVVAIVVMVGM